MKKMITFLFTLLFTISCSSSSNKSSVEKKYQKKEVQAVPSLLKLYAGPTLAEEQIVRIMSEQVDERYMYFINVDGEKIKNGSLIDGPREIHVLPGKHSLQLRFIAKGKLAIPLKKFPEFNFKKGKTYIVRSSLVYNGNDFVSLAKNTKVTVWLEESGSSNKLSLMTLNGLGR